MMHFVGGAGGTVTGRFESVEVGLLRLAATQLVDLLDAATAAPTEAAEDPALRRLLPDAYRDDPEAAAEFRRFTADGILDQKVRNARAVLSTLGPEPLEPDPLEGASGDPANVAVELDPASVQSWLRTLTDLRLTLAERLQIAPDGVQRLEGEEALFLRDVYDWLGMVQESLVYALDA